jgi:hypothetical protein
MPPVRVEIDVDVVDPVVQLVFPGSPGARETDLGRISDALRRPCRFLDRLACSDGQPAVSVADDHLRPHGDIITLRIELIMVHLGDTNSRCVDSARL